MAQADLVILASFDGPACRQVLEDVRGSLRADTIVLNTSTIAPAEASEPARQIGGSYVHAPVLGSVRAASGGTLLILTAASLALIAHNNLVGAVVALRDSLQQSDALGPSLAQALDVLELGQLGGLLSDQRPFSVGGSGAVTAELTTGALAYDMALLAAASNTPCAAQPCWPTPPGRPAPDEPTRSRRIDTIDVHGTVATAAVSLSHGADTFTDIFLLVRVDVVWRIANEACHRHS